MKQPHICLDETLGVRYAIRAGSTASRSSWRACASLPTTASSAA